LTIIPEENVLPDKFYFFGFRVLSVIKNISVERYTLKILTKTNNQKAPLPLPVW